MQISKEKLEEIIDRGGANEEELVLLFADCEAILKDRSLDANQYIDYFRAATFSIPKENDEDMSRMLTMLQEIKERLTEDGAILRCEYAFFYLYIMLGFTPKALEHALNILENKFNHHGIKAIACFELANMMENCGLYDEALEYMNKLSELKAALTESEAAFDPDDEPQLCLILAKTGSKDEFEKHKRALFELTKEEPEGPDGEMSILTRKMSYLYARAIAEGMTLEKAREYSDLVDSVINLEGCSGVMTLMVDGSETLWEMMYENGYLAECVNVCKKMIDNPFFFTGDFSGVYGIMLKCCRQDPSLLSQEEINKYQSDYLDLLEKQKLHMDRFMKHLVREEFRIREVDSAYDSLRVKYETDQMTGCYNRPSYEMNAADFVKNNPKGSLVFIDLDNLKRTNDSLGHDAGDMMLKSFVSGTLDILGKEDGKLYRYAGDEFILLANLDKKQLEGKMAAMIERFKTPVSFRNVKINIGFSYGIVPFEEAIESLEACDADYESIVQTAQNMADSRMYECKRTHKDSRRAAEVES